MIGQVEQKLKEANRLKQQGNQFYKNKQFTKALRSYHQANLFIAGMIDKKSPMAMYSKNLLDQKTSNQINTLKFSIFMNMGQIYILQSKYEKSLDILRKAEQINQNDKLFYRKAQCFMNLRDYQQAKANFQKVTDPSMQNEITNHLKQIKIHQVRNEQKSKNMFKKFFQDQ